MPALLPLSLLSPWLLLTIAILFEVAGTSLLKLSSGFERPLIGAAALGAYGLSLTVFAPALKVIPVGVAYAIWSGAGIVAVTIIGLTFFGQRLAAPQYLFIAMILIGAVGLQLTTGK